MMDFKNGAGQQRRDHDEWGSISGPWGLSRSHAEQSEAPANEEHFMTEILDLNAELQLP